MTRIYVVRHAEAEGNLYRRIHGWYNSQITDNGKRQIAALTHRFESVHFDAVYASDLQRTQMTAQSVVGPRHMELHIDPELKEIGMGIYERLPFGDLNYHDASAQKLFASCSPDWKPEGGESFAEVQERVTRAVLRIAHAHPGQTVGIFTHGAAIKCLQAAVRGKHPSETPELEHCENTGVSCYDVEGNHFKINYESDASHLPEEIATVARQKLALEKGPIICAWFRPLDMAAESQFYYNARKDAWQDVHHSLRSFDGAGFMTEAESLSRSNPRNVLCAMDNGTPAGVLQTDPERYADQGVGYIPFLYLRPEYRCRGVGIQLIGEAVCAYREMGRRCVQLSCSPDNAAAQRFYHRYGFFKTGELPGASRNLDLLQKDI